MYSGLLQMPDMIPPQVHTTQQVLVCLDGKFFLLCLLTFIILHLDYYSTHKIVVISTLNTTIYSAFCGTDEGISVHKYCSPQVIVMVSI